MNYLTCAFTLVMVVCCANADYVYRQVPILKYDSTRNNDGQHSLNYVTGDGISVSETGRLKPLSGVNRADLGKYAYVKEGTYSYTSPEGQFYKVDYVADENGYRASGAHLPKAPTYNPYNY